MGPLKAYASASGRQWTDWTAQVDFALQEARGFGINLQATDPAQAARDWTYDFEKPSNPDQRAAERAAVAHEYMLGDIPELGPYGHFAAPAGSRQNVVFYNTFNVGSGGAGNSVDLRRSVTQMADHLENEMKKRVSRSS